MNYDFDKDTLSTSGRAQAVELAKALKTSDFSGKHFRLIGHTDLQGPEDYNQHLSERRAERLRDYLVREQRLSAGSIQTEGRGKREPKVPGNTEEANAVNRRVEVQLLD